MRATYVLIDNTFLICKCEFRLSSYLRKPLDTNRKKIIEK